MASSDATQRAVLAGLSCGIGLAAPVVMYAATLPFSSVNETVVAGAVPFAVGAVAGVGIYAASLGISEYRAQREERQPLACEIALAEVGYVPSQGVVADFAAGIAAVRPHGGGPGRPFGQCEAVFGEEVQRFPHVSVYFGAFHSSV